MILNMDRSVKESNYQSVSFIIFCIQYKIWIIGGSDDTQHLLMLNSEDGVNWIKVADNYLLAKGNSQFVFSIQIFM